MKDFLSVAEVAELMGVSRVAIFKKIQSGEILAQKVGRNYIINREDLDLPKAREITEKQKKFIDKSVDRVIDEYEETLILLKDV